MTEENIVAAAGGPHLDYEVLADNLGAYSTMHYGVKITWRDPDPIGRKPERPFALYSFPELSMAESFAAMYDPEAAPAQGAAKVEIFYREAFEVYGEWAPHSKN